MYQLTRGVHKMNLVTVRKWGPASKAVVHRYTQEEVDFFLGYCLETDSVYVFPFSALVGRKKELTLWITQTPSGKNGSAPFDGAPYLNAYHLLSS